ncbi:MAG: hypothetical protein RMM58_10895 [Chloroflexota bacterium]|nr:hypothetical protein [Dehalococcoidia bacterium]MDW8254372.1 hypothetical protein [Chloroflexota bacterium]
MGGATYLFGSLLNVFAALVFAYLLWGVFGLLGAIALLPVAMVGVPLLMGLQYGLWQPLLGPLSVYVVAFVVYGVGRLLTGKHEPKEVTMIIGVVLGFIGLCVVWSYLSLLAGAVEIVSPDGTVRPLLTR